MPSGNVTYVHITYFTIAVLTTYSQWQRHIVGEDQDETFAKEFLGAAMTIFTRVWKQQSSISAQEKSHFSVSPKKVRQV